MALDKNQWIALADLLAATDNEDLNKIAKMYKAQRGRLATQQAVAFKIGQKVMFVGRYGVLEKGTVERINTKSVAVTTTSGNKWRVPPSLLKPAA